MIRLLWLNLFIARAGEFPVSLLREFRADYRGFLRVSAHAFHEITPKTKDFPVDSLPFRESARETDSLRTASRTKQSSSRPDFRLRAPCLRRMAQSCGLCGVRGFGCGRETPAPSRFPRPKPQDSLRKISSPQGMYDAGCRMPVVNGRNRAVLPAPTNRSAGLSQADDYGSETAAGRRQR